MATKASDLFIQALENEGVEYIFGVPGEENLDLLESIRTSNIKLILTRHEQGAGFMAATYGRLTGKVGVCLATLGPGATNFVTAAAYAHLGAFPMMMITGQKPIKKSKQGRFQIIDVVSTFKPMTKFSKQIVNGHTIPALVRESFRLATEERPGPVLLELPEDIAEEKVDDHYIIPTQEPVRPRAGDQPIEEAASLIKAAKSPLLLVGAGANRKRVIDELSALVKATGLHFANTQMGKGVIEGAPDKYVGTCALSAGDYVHCAIDRADLVIVVGHDVVEKPPFFMEGDDKKVIHVNFYSADIDEVYYPQHQVIGDIANSIGRLTRALGGWSSGENDYFNRVRDEVRSHVMEKAEDTGFPVIPQRFVQDVRAAMPDDGIIALDNGMYKIWFARNYRTQVAQTVLLDNALATMGAGLPSAMMASMLYPDRNVMAIAGDGGFMMNSQEMETAVRLNLNLVVLVLNDNSYGMIRWKQGDAGFPDWGLEYNNPDFVAYAEAYGAKGHRVSKTGELTGLIQSCFKKGGVHLIDLPIDYAENKKLSADLAERVCLI